MKTDVSPHAFLDRRLDEEIAYRKERRMHMSLRLSGLPTDRRWKTSTPLIIDEVLATAILDCLLHDSHISNVEGRSYRRRDLERAMTQQS